MFFIVHHQALDVASLLRVYLNFDLIDQATSLAVEYLSAVTDVLGGVDAPAFALKASSISFCILLDIARSIFYS